MQFARQWTQKPVLYCVLFDGQSELSTTVSQCKREKRNNSWYSCHATEEPAARANPQDQQKVRKLPHSGTRPGKKGRERPSECRGTWIWNHCQWARLHAMQSFPGSPQHMKQTGKVKQLAEHLNKKASNIKIRPLKALKSTCTGVQAPRRRNGVLGCEACGGRLFHYSNEEHVSLRAWALFKAHSGVDELTWDSVWACRVTAAQRGRAGRGPRGPPAWMKNVTVNLEMYMGSQLSQAQRWKTSVF